MATVATRSAVPTRARESEELARTLGMWSALGAAVVLAVGTILFVLSEQWTDLAAYAAGFNASKLTGWVLYFLLTLFFVPVVASIHALTPERLRLLSLTGLGFAVMYAAICAATCALQFTFVRHQILAGRLAGLEPWVAASPNSVMFALDNLGFFLQGIATLFLAPLFGGRRITNAIRWLLVVNGIGTIVLIALTGVMSFSSASGQTLYRASTVVWAALLTTALLLVARAFQRRLLPGFHETEA
jgi:hypothetical protein